MMPSRIFSKFNSDENEVTDKDCDISRDSRFVYDLLRRLEGIRADISYRLNHVGFYSDFV